MELPSISQVHSSRGPVDGSWYNPQYAPRPTVSSERLPALGQISQPAPSSASSSPRGGSFSGSSVYTGSNGSATSYTPSVTGQANGYKTPSPEQTPSSYARDSHGLNESPYPQQPGYNFGGETPYNNMNSIAPYADVHQQPPHLAAHHSQMSGPPAGLGHYAYHQQPLQQAYQPQQQPYGSYSYATQQGHPVTSMGSTLIPQSQPLPLPAMSAGVASGLTASQFPSGHTFDTSGQIAPPGMKPRVTATLWEDEGSLCFQVEAKGVCVAHNHMINGTKLLNVAGMTRGRRDGILKSEKTRHVVKIGPMHLKGVWIPFDRALDFANKEKITEQLYPLFVHDIGALLYHPSNQQRPGMANASALAAVDRRRSDSTRFMAGGPQTTQSPSLHHHHSMSQPMNAQPQHSIAPHPSSGGRPGLDRAHTFPTPPTSASSNFGVGSHGSSDYWNGQQTQPGLSINTELSNTRSVPTTPASTPPGLQPYQTSQAYEASRQVYTAPPSQGQYPSQYRGQQQFGGPLPSSGLSKSEMAPPPRAGEVDVHEVKSQPPHGEEEAEHEQESEYTHTPGQYNGARQGSYSYNPNAGVARVSDDVTSSPHQNGSGRATPRTAGAPEAQWQPAYPAQPGPQAAASNVYQVMEPRAVNGEQQYAQYPSTYVNGGLPSAKRVREIDDDEVEEGLKRQKTHEEGGPVGGGSSPFNPTNRPRVQAVSRKATR
ncbi:apses-domain-containing protein [Venturia nashicola]|nr:apses-domain-containing protein [Venturia nashicola]